MSKFADQLSFYISWWLQGLRYLFPEKVQAFFTTGPDEIAVRVDGDTIAVQHITHESKILDKHTYELGDKTQSQSLENWVSSVQSQHETRLIYRLSRAEVLHKTVFMPASAKATLRQILTIEMDRSTPFKSSDVYFDYFLHKEADQQNRLRVDLYVVKKSLIDTILKTIGSLSLKIDAIALEKNTVPYQLDFLPQEEKAKKHRSTFPLTSVLTALFFLAISAAVYLPIYGKQTQLDELQQSINKYRQEALKVQAIKDKKQKLIDRRESLLQKYTSQVSAIGILNELTAKLPDSTWVSRLVLNGNQLQLHGESGNATELVPLLESVPLFTKVQFQSTTTINTSNQKEKFQLLMSLGESE